MSETNVTRRRIQSQIIVPCKTHGCYAIVNIVNGKRYIGSGRLTERRYGHFSTLRNNKHLNAHLQRAWNKYGAAAFEFRVLFYCDKYECLSREQDLLDRECPEYNIARNATAPMLGLKDSAETKRKKSESHIGLLKGRKLTVEHKQKLRLAHSGKRLSEEHKMNIANGCRGGTCGSETRRKISKALAGRVKLKLSDDTKRKIVEATSGSKNHFFGKHHSEETKRKISIAKSGRRFPKKHG